jgi:hypothetical protein
MASLSLPRVLGIEIRQSSQSPARLAKGVRPGLSVLCTKR